MKLYIEYEIQQKHHTIMSYNVIYLYSFAKCLSLRLSVYNSGRVL